MIVTLIPSEVDCEKSRLGTTWQSGLVTAGSFNSLDCRVASTGLLAIRFRQTLASSERSNLRTSSTDAILAQRHRYPYFCGLFSRMVLHNRVNGKVLKERLREEAVPRTTLSFYRYVVIPRPGEFRDELYKTWNELGVLGRAYVAHEGINAQVSVPSHNVDAFKISLEGNQALKSMRLNLAIEDNGKSFFKLKIQVRNKIVADGITDKSFDVTRSGPHLDAAEFNLLAAQPDTIIVDMRNHYESEVGHFKNAICPDADTFRDELRIVETLLAEQREKNVVMYCTGGIRCEKASAWMMHKGFQHVYQLDGGIIEYTRQVREQGLENKFIGKNFVFDERLGERISDDVIAKCHQCGKACDSHANCSNDGCHLLFIQCSECAARYSSCCSVECQTIIQLPETAKKELRKGVNKGRQVFRKGRSAHLIGSQGN